MRLEQAGDEAAIVHVAVRRISKEDLGDVYDTKGRVTGTQKRASVFALLSKEPKPGVRPALSRSQAAHGQSLFELYAHCHGIAGSAEYDDPGLIDGGKRTNDQTVMDGAMQARRRVRNGEEWARIMAYVGPPSARLLEALCVDYWRGDGFAALNGSGEPVPRWRAVLERLGVTDRDRQSERVVIACEALEDYADGKRRRG